MNIEQVKSMGNKVNITHLRRGANKADRDWFYTKQQWKNMQRPVHNMGGITTVCITTPTGQVLIGKAICSNKDNFCKKFGIQLALERAMTSGE